MLLSGQPILRLQFIQWRFIVCCRSSIIRSHNLWIRSWPVAVTLVGWFLIFIGLFRMFSPGFVLKSVQNTGYIFIVPTMGVLVVGIYLTFKANSREHTKTDDS